MISSSSVRVRKAEVGPPVYQAGATNGRGVSPYQSVQEDSHEPNRFRSHRATGTHVGSFLLRPTSRSLKGLRVGLVENTKFNSEVILRKIAERLAARYQITLTHLDRKKSPGHSVTPAAITFFQQKADFVLAGVGD